MNRKFAGKIGVIAILTLLLLIPLSMVKGVIWERSSYRHQAKESIAQSWTGAQKFLGPVLVQPYVEHHQRKVWDSKKENYRLEAYTESKKLYLLPEQLLVTGTVNTEERSRGIYTVPVYEARMKIEGAFSNQALLDVARGSKVSIDWQRPYLAVAVSDIRGVVTQPQLHWSGKDYVFDSGSGLAELGGMHVRVAALDVDKAAQYHFDFEVDLHGMEQLDFSPVGKNTEVNLSSDWPHPSFTGRYLPAQRTISDNAFEARWQVSSFSSEMVQTMEALARGQVGDFNANTFGVSLINAVDVYQQTERSAKYGVLFVSLTFVVFFLFEVMKGLRLHPMQYLLVGLALTVFFLLLISLAEHIPFAAAYAIASLASVCVIGIYISEVLQSRPRAAAFSALLSLLYAMLFAILRSEDNALLMGSLLLFGTLTLVMVITRKLDWYSIAEQMTRQTVLLGDDDKAGTQK